MYVKEVCFVWLEIKLLRDFNRFSASNFIYYSQKLQLLYSKNETHKIKFKDDSH